MCTALWWCPTKGTPGCSQTASPLLALALLVCLSESHVCRYRVTYAEQSSIEGSIIEDHLWLAEDSVPIVFGCQTHETGPIFAQHADGIIGLAASPLSIHAQLVSQGAIDAEFTLCYGSDGGAQACTAAPHELARCTDRFLFNTADACRWSGSGVHSRGVDGEHSSTSASAARSSDAQQCILQRASARSDPWQLKCAR